MKCPITAQKGNLLPLFGLWAVIGGKLATSQAMRTTYTVSAQPLCETTGLQAAISHWVECIAKRPSKYEPSCTQSDTAKKKNLNQHTEAFSFSLSFSKRISSPSESLCTHHGSYNIRTERIVHFPPLFFLIYQWDSTVYSAKSPKTTNLKKGEDSTCTRSRPFSKCVVFALFAECEPHQLARFPVLIRKEPPTHNKELRQVYACPNN